jgi:hypothetical protein
MAEKPSLRDSDAPVTEAHGPKVIPPNLTLGRATQPPGISKEEAVSAAQSVWKPELFAVHPWTAEYGSYAFSLVIDGTPVGTVNVWKITMSGVSVSVPGGTGGTPAFRMPQPLTHMVIFVSGDSGKVLMSTGY